MWPLVEPYDEGQSLVTFAWRGEAESIRAWHSIDVELTRVPGTDLWRGSAVFPSDLRTIYCLAKDGVHEMPASASSTGPAILDPLNPSRLHFPADPTDPTDSDGWASVLELPAASPSPWLTPHLLSGRLEDAAFASAPFGYAVTTTAYLPRDVDPTGLPTLLVFDGHQGLTVMSIPTALDNLIAAGAIPPMAALFIRGREDSRVRDLTPGPALQHLVVDELLPLARARWGIGGGPLIAAGWSRGGLVATHLALARPDLFRAAIAHSGSFWWPGDLPPGRTSPGTRFYLDVGSLETSGGPDAQLTVVRAMRDELRARGCEVTYTEFTGGHDFINWRHNFPDALIAVAAAR